MWERLKELDGVGLDGLPGGGRNQYGFRASVLSFPDETAIVNGAQPIRWQGEVWDILPWRVYLGPWSGKDTLALNSTDNAIVADFAAPAYLWKARSEIAFTSDMAMYARVQWGTSTASHIALVDWPVAGLLMQVSGSYVSVDALAVPLIEDPTTIDITKLPDVTATLSLEPGGGDSARSATFSFPTQALDWSTSAGINFPVPPFARSVYLQWDNTRNGADTNYATAATIRFCRADVAPATGSEAVYVYDFAAGAIGDPREGIPVPPSCAYVRVEPTFSVGSTKVFAVGASFELDL
jgi:hypothetical protein